MRKISLMWKLLIIVMLSNWLFASKTDENILDFLKNSIISNEKFDVKNISIKSSQDLKQIENWRVYFANVHIYLKEEKQDVNLTEIVFSDGKYFTREFIKLKSRESIKDELTPTINTTLYKDSHLIAGNKNAENKLVIFSDPNCPFCMNFVPFVIDLVKKYPKIFVLYYYDFPLNIHKSATTYIKATLVAQKQGLKDALYKVYKARIRSTTDNEEELVKVFNEALNTNVTIEQMNEKWVLDKIAYDEKIAKEMLVNATPTLFINGKKDLKREKLKALYEKAEGKK